jgi:hypothetical protein
VKVTGGPWRRRRRGEGRGGRLLFAFKARGHGSREGREVYLQSRLLKRTVLVARAQTALYRKRRRRRRYEEE